MPSATLTYEDVSLIPRKLSKVRSRRDIDLSITIHEPKHPFTLRMPILPAPMDTICGLQMCRAFAKNGMLGMIHRFQPQTKRLADYQTLHKDGIEAVVAVGLDEDTLVRKFHRAGARFFIIDVANGFNISVEPIIKTIQDLDATFTICGNVASYEGFCYLVQLGVDAIRIGIGTGSMCTTSIMTGIGQGIVSAIKECARAKKDLNSATFLIADGGVRNVGDIAKALALGADLVMLGRMFAGTKESEGNILKFDQKLYKAYRGSASYAVQKKSGKSPYYIEGDETIVEYKGGVQNIFDQIEAGLRSAFSYMNARTLVEFQKNAIVNLE